MSFPGADPGFLEKGVYIYKKCEGFALLQKKDIKLPVSSIDLIKHKYILHAG